MIGLNAYQGAHFAEAMAAAGFYAGVGDLGAELYLCVFQMLCKLQHFSIDLIGAACETSRAAADEDLTLLSPQTHLTFLTEVPEIISRL